MTVYRVSNYLDDCLYKLDVFFLVSDGVVRLADVPQSENLLLCSRHFAAAVLSSFLMWSMEDHRVPLITEFLFQMEFQPSTTLLVRCPVRTSVGLGQMSC